MVRIPLIVVMVWGIFANAWAESSTAMTQPPGTPSVSEASPQPFALGLNSPLGWAFGSFGASGYVLIEKHFAVRGNVARWTDGGALGALLREDAAGGSITDVGIGGVWYPLRAWGGPLIEIGALLRSRDTYRAAFDVRVTTRSTRVAGRALIGWSWDITSNVFVAFAVGGSWGRESGKVTSVDDGDPGEAMTTPLRRKQLEGESYLRFGLAFGS
jgi:hypothetical protein